MSLSACPLGAFMSSVGSSQKRRVTFRPCVRDLPSCLWRGGLDGEDGLFPQGLTELRVHLQTRVSGDNRHDALRAVGPRGFSISCSNDVASCFPTNLSNVQLLQVGGAQPRGSPRPHVQCAPTNDTGELSHTEARA